MSRCTEVKLDDRLSLEAAWEMQFHATLSHIILFSVENENTFQNSVKVKGTRGLYMTLVPAPPECTLWG